MTAPFKRMTGSIIESDGLLWKPRRGVRAKAEEFVTAQRRLRAILSGSRSTLLCPGPLRTVLATHRGTRLKQALMVLGLVAEVRGRLRQL